MGMKILMATLIPQELMGIMEPSRSTVPQIQIIQKLQQQQQEEMGNSNSSGIKTDRYKTNGVAKCKVDLSLCTVKSKAIGMMLDNTKTTLLSNKHHSNTISN